MSFIIKIFPNLINFSFLTFVLICAPSVSIQIGMEQLFLINFIDLIKFFYSDETYLILED